MTYATFLRGAGLAVCVSLLTVTVQAADISRSGKRDEAPAAAGGGMEQIEPGLEQVRKDADAIPEPKVEETDRNLEKSLSNQPKMSTDPNVKEYIRLN